MRIIMMMIGVWEGPKENTSTATNKIFPPACVPNIKSIWEIDFKYTFSFYQCLS